MAYRIYDSYLKKGTVTRDTVHRFMTDIYGDDSYKKPNAKALLDVIFHPEAVAAGADGKTTTPVSPLQASVTQAQFCRRTLDTIRPAAASSNSHSPPQHLLLDWIAVLVNSMAPPSAAVVSVTAYLEAMNSTRPPLCQVYALADHRLYEIKRRFHSMVQQQPVQQGSSGGSGSPLLVTQPPNGDPMASPPTVDSQHGGGGTAAAAMDASQSGGGNFNSNSSSSHKVISEAAFCHFATRSSEEMGSGGYLTAKLARLVFRAGCCCSTSPSSSTTTEASLSLLAQQPQLSGWGLFHLLQFGCLAVRQDTIKKEDPDVQLLRFVFAMFQLPSSALTHADDSQNGMLCDGEDGDEEEEIDKRILTRKQVAWMLLRLVEHAEFRRRADCSPLDLDDDDDDDKKQRKASSLESDNVEETKVTLATAVRLGLLLPPEGSKPTDRVPLREIVDQTMKETATQDQMTFDEFCGWNRRRGEEKKRGPVRLAPLMIELRLIASVQYGIPPTLASMEIALIAEIEKRHRSRYPQSEVSRRGPRGTVWNIIDANWYKTWTSLVKKVAGTAEDHADGRGDPRNDRVRGLMRISNTGLLVENGSLSLRPDIRWKHDYELVPPLAWSALQAWYDGGPPIHRTVVKYVASSGAATSPHSSREMRIPTENEIELYPFFVTVYLCDAASRGEARPFQQNYQLSRVSPILVMLVQLCRELDVDPDWARLWVMGSLHSGGGTGNSSYASMTHDTMAGPEDARGEDWILSSDMNIVDQLRRRGISKDGGKILLLELKDKESGKWPRGVDGKDWSFRGPVAPEQIPTDIGDGVVGMYNMG